MVVSSVKWSWAVGEKKPPSLKGVWSSQAEETQKAIRAYLSQATPDYRSHEDYILQNPSEATLHVSWPAAGCCKLRKMLLLLTVGILARSMFHDPTFWLF